MLSVERKKANVRKEATAVSGMEVTIVRKNQKTLPPQLPSQHFPRGRSVSSKRSIRGKSNHGSILRQPCRYYLKGFCTRSPCEYWHPPECQFYKNRNGLQGWRQSVCSRITRLMNNRTKKPKKSDHSPKKKRKLRQETLWLL